MFCFKALVFFDNSIKWVLFKSEKHVLKLVFLSMIAQMNIWVLSVLLKSYNLFHIFATNKRILYMGFFVFLGNDYVYWDLGELPKIVRICSKKKYFVCWDRDGTQIVVQPQGIQSSWKKLSRNSRPSNKPILVILLYHYHYFT